MKHEPRISMIAAIGKRTRAIGKDNKLLWNIPEDLAYFKRVTKGHPIIMGHKTFASIGRALPGRLNIVVSRNQHFSYPHVMVAHSVENALRLARQHEKKEIFIIGGGQIYTAALPATDRLYLTLVDDDADGDTYFPPYEAFSQTISRENRKLRGLLYSFVVLER